MKLTFDAEKTKAFVKKNVRVIVLLAIIFVFAVLTLGSYLILFPPEDRALIRQKQEEIKAYDINFNRLELEELAAKKAPSVINANGGRNPFMPY